HGLARLGQLQEANRGQRAVPQPTVRGQKKEEEPEPDKPALIRTTAIPFVFAEVVSERVQVARELLDRGREDFLTREFKRSLERCRLLSASYAELPEGEAARNLATRNREALALPSGQVKEQ